MKLIPLSKTGKYAGLYSAMVDDEDYEYLNQFDWQVIFGANTFYAHRAIYHCETKKQTQVAMHREILNIKNKKDIIDHKDRNGLNNTRLNLRLADNSKNGANRTHSKTTSSKYNGVNWHKGDKTWRVRITLNGKQICLGSSRDESIAAKKYDEAAKKYFGEFANLNFK